MMEPYTDRWFTKRFLILIILTFIAFLVIMYASANQAYDYAHTADGAVIANQTANQISSERQVADSFTIFLNNFEISVVAAFPIVGIFPLIITLANTGQILGLLAAVVGISPFSYFEAISLIMLPETLAYSLLAAEGTYVGALLLTRSGATQRILRHSWKTFILYVLILFVTAVVEGILIGANV